MAKLVCDQKANMSEDNHSENPREPEYEGSVTGCEKWYFYKGTRFSCPPFFKENVLKCEQFDFRASDIVLSAFPKSGNTWMQEIIWLIQNCDDLVAATNTGKSIMQRFPLMEMAYGPDTPAFVDTLAKQEGPRLINTHLPVNIIVPQLEKTKPKVVVVLRNPKDQIVSFFHFLNKVPGVKIEKFSDLFKMATTGNTPYGYYIKYAKEWWAERHKENVFTVTYEDMKADHYGAVERLAKFLEKDLIPEQIQQIVNLTTFDNMKGRNVPQEGKVGGGKLADDAFFRKGIVGDWQNYMTKEMSDYIEAECKAKLEPEGLVFKFSL